MQRHLQVLLIACVVTLITVVVAECPTSCQCRDIPAEPDAGDVPSSDATILTAIACIGNPPGGRFPITTGSIAVTRLSRTSLEALLTRLVNINITVDLPHFAEISISRCDLRSIDTGIGRLAWLRSLDVSQNAINRLEHTAFDNLTNLVTLDLSCNKIKVLSGKPFVALSHLERLNLSANFIYNISDDAFCNAHELQYLDLSMNNLSVLEEDVFAPLIGLQYLNLSVNRLETLGEECFSRLARLQQLDVSHNRLTSVAPGALQALPSLARLLLAGNPSLGDLLVGTGRRLQTVDASRTGLAHVPPALTHSVRTLRLAGNAIHSVRCGDLDSYPLLQLLDFKANGLESIEEDSLGRQEMLSTLYLTDNKLRAVPRSLPAGLKTLHLEQNRVEHLKVGEIAGLTQLEVLLLNDNEIATIEEGALDDLTSLITLDISGNPLTILGGGVLAGLISLQVLRLAGLPVATAARDTAFPVHAPERLVSLDLTASPGLARVFLADNAALAASRELQELSVADAGLAHIRPDLLHFLPQLRVLKLDGNRLDCSRLLWLATWMRQQNRPEDRAVLCASPPDLAGSLIVDLQEGDLPTVTGNAETTTPSNRYVIAHHPKFARADSTINNTITTINPSTQSALTIIDKNVSSQSVLIRIQQHIQPSEAQPTVPQSNLYPITAANENSTIIKNGSLLQIKQTSLDKSTHKKNLTNKNMSTRSPIVITTNKTPSSSDENVTTRKGSIIKSTVMPVVETSRQTLTNIFYATQAYVGRRQSEQKLASTVKNFNNKTRKATPFTTTPMPATTIHDNRTENVRNSTMSKQQESMLITKIYSKTEDERNNSISDVEETDDETKKHDTFVKIKQSIDEDKNKTNSLRNRKRIKQIRKNESIKTIVAIEAKEESIDNKTTVVQQGGEPINMMFNESIASSKPRFILDLPEAMRAQHVDHVTAATYTLGSAPSMTAGATHPGMLVLVLVLLSAVGAALALTMLASHFTSSRRRRRTDAGGEGDEDERATCDSLEIAHMPGVTDLW